MRGHSLNVRDYSLNVGGDCLNVGGDSLNVRHFIDIIKQMRNHDVFILKIVVRGKIV